LLQAAEKQLFFEKGIAVAVALCFSSCHPRRACPEQSRMGDLLLFVAFAFIFLRFLPRNRVSSSKTI
jgi:hypothetical protein